MNPIGPRPYMAQGYKREEESEQKTQDSLQQDGGRNGQQQNPQNQQNQPKFIGITNTSHQISFGKINAGRTAKRRNQDQTNAQQI